MAFTAGDQVRLKSGGPRMTVETVGNPLVFCSWFDGAKREQAGFKAEALKRVEDTPDISAESGDYDPLAEWRG